MEFFFGVCQTKINSYLGRLEMGNLSKFIFRNPREFPNFSIFYVPLSEFLPCRYVPRFICPCKLANLVVVLLWLYSILFSSECELSFGVTSGLLLLIALSHHLLGGKLPKISFRLCQVLALLQGKNELCSLTSN